MKWKTTNMQNRKEKKIFKSNNDLYTCIHYYLMYYSTWNNKTIPKKEKNRMTSLPCSDSTVISA